MPARNAARKGFTLVEILIVVVILGILAAIVIPQFTSASETAKASSLVSQLQTLRSQLELYQVQHNGSYPSTTSATFWDQLTGETNISGSTSPASTDITYGPYLQKEINNPFEDSSDIQVSSTSPLPATATAGAGWLYNGTTGEIKAIVSATKASEVGLDSADGDIATY